MYWSGHSSLNMDGQRHLRLPALYNMQLLDFLLYVILVYKLKDNKFFQYLFFSLLLINMLKRNLLISIN